MALSYAVFNDVTAAFVPEPSSLFPPSATSGPLDQVAAHCGALFDWLEVGECSEQPGGFVCGPKRAVKGETPVLSRPARCSTLMDTA